jgi:hypothetical protein
MDYTVDQILHKLLGEYNPNFIGMSDASRFKLNIRQRDRMVALTEATKVKGGLKFFIIILSCVLEEA